MAASTAAVVVARSLVSAPPFPFSCDGLESHFSAVRHAVVALLQALWIGDIPAGRSTWNRRRGWRSQECCWGWRWRGRAAGLALAMRAEGKPPPPWRRNRVRAVVMGGLLTVGGDAALQLMSEQDGFGDFLH